MTTTASISISQKLPTYNQKIISLDKIVKLHKVPEYLTPSSFPHPIVIEFEEEKNIYYILDGDKIYKDAIKNHRSKITCLVDTEPAKTRAELYMKRMDVRMRSASTGMSYVEIAWNIFAGCAEIRKSGVKFIERTHGGDRKSINVNKDVKGLTQLLSIRWDKAPSTINSAINHIEYLSDSSLKKLIKKKAGKNFFENIRANKTALIKKLKHDGLSQAVIKKTVSDKVSEWHNEYVTNKTIDSVPVKVKKSGSMKTKTLTALTSSISDISSKKSWATIRCNDIIELSNSLLKSLTDKQSVKDAEIIRDRAIDIRDRTNKKFR